MTSTQQQHDQNRSHPLRLDRQRQQHNIIDAGDDTCACRPCLYPNGWILLLTSQILLLLAILCSTVVLLDCQFVTVDASTVAATDGIFSSNNATTSITDGEQKRLGLGFLFHEEMDGSCRWWDHDSQHYPTHETMEAYWDWLGSDWDDPRGAGVAATCWAAGFWIWLLVWSCVAQPRWLRLTYGAVLVIVLVTLQAGTFAVLESDLCTDQYDCQLGRSGRYGAFAVVLFAVSGVLVCFTPNYPGRRQRQSTMNSKPTNEMASTAPTEEDIEVQATTTRLDLSLSTIQEASVESSELMDISLVDSSPKAQFKAHQMARVY